MWALMEIIAYVDILREEDRIHFVSGTDSLSLESGSSSQTLGVW